MKSTTFYKIFAVALVIAFTTTAIAQAQTPPQGDDGMMPPPQGQDQMPDQNTQDGTPPSGTDGIREQVENRLIQNRGVRNTELQGRQGSSTMSFPGGPRPFSSTTPMRGDMGGRFSSTSPMQGGMQGEMQDGMMRGRMGSTSPMWHGSTSPMMGGPRGGMPGMMHPFMDGMMKYASTSDAFRRMPGMATSTAKRMPLNTFETRKNLLLTTLNDALSNLDNIAGRIQTEITKVEGDGHSLPNADTLFATAQTKLATARTDVAEFQAATATSTDADDGDANGNTDASTTVQVDLTKPRTLGDAAIQATKDARDAMEQVVNAIISAVGENASTSTNNQ